MKHQLRSTCPHVKLDRRRDDETLGTSAQDDGQCVRVNNLSYLIITTIIFAL